MFDAQFGGLDKFKKQFSAFAHATFGSGWTWLVSHQGEWSVMNTINAGTPLAAGFTPLLALDMWEHSYYLDYQDNVQVRYDANRCHFCACVNGVLTAMVIVMASGLH